MSGVQVGSANSTFSRIGLEGFFSKKNLSNLFPTHLPIVIV